MPDNLIERAFGWPLKLMDSVDDVGRGSWAGPVVSSVVVLNEKNIPD